MSNKNNMIKIKSVLLLVIFGTSFTLAAKTKVKIVQETETSADNTVITIGKKVSEPTPDYSVESFDEWILGEADYSSSVARRNYDKVCSEWKKELKTRIQKPDLLSFSCGAAVQEKSEGQVIYKSNANYTMRVLLKR